MDKWIELQYGVEPSAAQKQIVGLGLKLLRSLLSPSLSLVIFLLFKNTKPSLWTKGILVSLFLSQVIIVIVLVVMGIKGADADGELWGELFVAIIGGVGAAVIAFAHLNVEASEKAKPGPVATDVTGSASKGNGTERGAGDIGGSGPNG